MSEFRSPFQIYAPVPDNEAGHWLRMVCPDCGYYLKPIGPPTPYRLNAASGWQFTLRHAPAGDRCNTHAVLVVRDSGEVPYLEVRRGFEVDA